MNEWGLHRAEPRWPANQHPLTQALTLTHLHQIPVEREQEPRPDKKNDQSATTSES